MKTFDVPDWVIAPFCKLGVFEDDYHLYGACRALGFVRMAAAALEKMGNSEEETDPQKVAEYHAYAGISAARTAIDAAASWLKMVLKLNFPSGNRVDLSKKEFRSEVANAQAEIGEYLQTLGCLGKEINDHRQRAQHREGLAIVRHLESEVSGHRGGWYLAPEGVSHDPQGQLHLVELLNCWAKVIEINLREIHERVKG